MAGATQTRLFPPGPTLFVTHRTFFAACVSPLLWSALFALLFLHCTAFACPLMSSQLSLFCFVRTPVAVSFCVAALLLCCFVPHACAVRFQILRGGRGHLVVRHHPLPYAVWPAPVPEPRRHPNGSWYADSLLLLLHYTLPHSPPHSRHTISLVLTTPSHSFWPHHPNRPHRSIPLMALALCSCTHLYLSLCLTTPSLFLTPPSQPSSPLSRSFCTLRFTCLPASPAPAPTPTQAGA